MKQRGIQMILSGRMRRYLDQKNIPEKDDAPVRPEKNIPLKPDVDPDPTKPRPGVNEPEKTDPTRIEEPEKTDPTRIDDPPPTKPPPAPQQKNKITLF